jgi:tRNA 2-thiocytidine biosynthesis protein TtcA
VVEISSFAAKEIKRLMGKAIHKHQMIKSDDHVMVALSGGKDSFSLLWLLRERIKRVPIEYEITAVHVDPGFGSDSAAQIEATLSEYGFEYVVLRGDFGPRAHSAENRENPCFLCSRLRRKLLFKKAQELGCSKIAFGHHKDDLIETFFLNVFYGASLSTMLPLQTFFDGKLTVIRPLYMVEEEMIRRFASRLDWPKIDLGCPTSGSTKRDEIKQMLNHFYGMNKKIRGNIFHALQNVRPEYLL